MPSGRRPKRLLKIPKAPADLGVFVAGVCQRHDHVVVGLRESGTMAGELFLALDGQRR